MSKVANDNVDESEAIARWTLRGVYAAADEKSKHDPMGGEDGIYYLFPPDAGVHFFLVEFGHTRREAEFLVNIT